MSDIYLSRAGYEKLVVEFNSLKKRKAELSKEIGEAASKGDLKENGEYHAAKEKQAETLRRIHEIDDKLRRAQILEDLKVHAGTVQIGIRVTLLEVDSKDESTWTLVGAEEADPAEGKLSVYSPLAQGLLGAKQGDQVVVKLPVGPTTFKIVKAEPAV